MKNPAAGLGVAIETGLDPNGLRCLIDAHETWQNLSERNYLQQEDFGVSIVC
jgi:hypothetical protein